MAVKHHRPWIHVDLNKTPAFKAVTLICSWIDENAIEILNVAGPRASKDDQIYPAVLKLIESVHYMELMTTAHPQAVNFQNNGRASTQQQPETLREAIEILISNLPLREKTTIANMVEEELIKLNASLGRYIMDKFGLWSGNEKLMESCLELADYPLRDEDDAAAVIVKELWLKLRQTHKLRIVR
jgi:hypothetical protein